MHAGKEKKPIVYCSKIGFQSFISETHLLSRSVLLASYSCLQYLKRCLVYADSTKCTYPSTLLD